MSSVDSCSLGVVLRSEVDSCVYILFLCVYLYHVLFLCVTTLKYYVSSNGAFV